MARAIEESPSNDCPKLFECRDINDLKDMSIKDFVTKSTMTFFQRLNIVPDFLKEDPEKWESVESYKKGT